MTCGIKSARRHFWSPTGPSHAPAPFYISLANASAHGALAHGLFLNSHGFTAFDVGKSSRQEMWISSPDPVLDYFLFAGPTLAKVLEQFTALSGRLSLPPKWSLGMKYDYDNGKQDERFDESLTAAFAAHGIAQDRVILEPGWQQPQFLWDKARPPPLVPVGTLLYGEKGY